MQEREKRHAEFTIKTTYSQQVTLYDRGVLNTLLGVSTLVFSSNDLGVNSHSNVTSLSTRGTRNGFSNSTLNRTGSAKCKSMKVKVKALTTKLSSPIVLLNAMLLN